MTRNQVHFQPYVDEQPMDAWTIVSLDHAREVVSRDRVRYGINYAEIIELVHNGATVEISLENISESAIRSAMSYHANYHSMWVSCRLTRDRRHLIISRPNTYR